MNAAGVFSQTCDEGGTCKGFGNPTACCKSGTSNIICADNFREKPKAADFARCETACVTKGAAVLGTLTGIAKAPSPPPFVRGCAEKRRSNLL